MNITEELIREIVTRVVEKAVDKNEENSCGFEKKTDPSGVIGIKTSTVRCERFKQDGVALKDVTSLSEAPRVGAGVMEVDHTSFEWTLTYDEYDVVLEGRLEIVIDGRVVAGDPGDILYIPKGSHIQFRSGDKCRYVYFVYPANWSDLI